MIVRRKDCTALPGDLFLAKSFNVGKAGDLTYAEETLGDVRFLTSERTRGEEEGDERSGLYGLGALLFSVLT